MNLHNFSCSEFNFAEVLFADQQQAVTVLTFVGTDSKMEKVAGAF